MSTASPARPLTLGIDPDVEKPGIAVYDAESGRLVLCEARPLYQVTAWLWDGAPCEHGTIVLVCLEDTRDRPLYAKHRNAAASPAARDRMARSIGRLDEVTRLLEHNAREGGLDVRSCDPVRKVDAIDFERVTGWEGRTGQEARDAGMLCWMVDPRRHDHAALRYPQTPA